MWLAHSSRFSTNGNLCCLKRGAWFEEIKVVLHTVGIPTLAKIAQGWGSLSFAGASVTA
jgi:hypothetical protein